MLANSEIIEIVAFLQNRNDYVIWAGFARYAHLGLPYSLDIDIFTKTRDSQKLIVKEMQNRGWRLQEQKQNPLIKSDTTF